MCFYGRWAPAHMHASVALAFKNAKLWLYITAPNYTPYIQGCDTKVVNRAFKSSFEESYAKWMKVKLMGNKQRHGLVPVPSRKEIATWVLEAFNAIAEGDIRAACHAAYFPKGMKLSELEDLNYFANSNFDSSFDSDSRMDSDEYGCISELCSSSNDSSVFDDNSTDLFWAKAARGVWRMAHFFDGKLYFTRDHMQSKFVPKKLKLPEPKPAPKPGQRHLQLVTMCSCSASMVYHHQKGFQAKHL